MIQMTFTKAMMDFFGRLPGQSVGDFANELKALTVVDREYFKREFRKINIEITG